MFWFSSLPVETGQLCQKLVSPLKGLVKSPFSGLFLILAGTFQRPA